MNTPLRTSGWKKYSNIIVAIILLLIITIVTIILAYRNADQAAQNTDRINASARLSTFAQNIKNDVYNIDIFAKEVTLAIHNDEGFNSRPIIDGLIQNIRVEQGNLNHAAKIFDQTLNAFRNGGTLLSESGTPITINAMNDPVNIKVLDSIDEIWQPYQRLIRNFSNSLDKNSLNRDAINYATDYARIFNDRISALSEKITDNLSNTSTKQSQRAQLYLISGLIAAILIATYLIFIAFRQLINADRALVRSQRELDDIMDTITEGLFLVDENLIIGEQHSAELEYILRTDNIAHREFTDLLKDRVTKKDIENAEGFLEQLFNEAVYEDLIESLNPLSRVHIIADDAEQSGTKEDVYLSFNFHRVYEETQIKSVLVSVKDITENVLLEQQLEKERLENESKLEMLSTILQVDPKLMNDFLNHVDSGGNDVNATLMGADNKPATLTNKLNRISRIIHGLKGEASALSLDSFTTYMEKIEDDIAEIRKKSNITGRDFLGLTMHLDEVLTLNQKARDLFKRISAGKLSIDDVNTPQEHSTQEYLNRFAKQVAERNGNKSVKLECIGLDNPELTETQQSDLRELTLQLLRNAIVHGIETPAQRMQSGKHGEGSIDIRLAKGEDGQWRYSFSDDGAGINFDKLRELAVKSGKFKATNPRLISQRELIRFMFESGTSTAKVSGEDAGRGVGMDVIREAIQRLGGKLQVQSEAEQYTRFNIRFPAKGAHQS